MKSMDPKLSNDTQFFKMRPFYDDVAPFELNLFQFFHRFPRFFDIFLEFMQILLEY